MRQIKITERITKRDSVSLNKYLADISPLPMVSAEEEVELCKKIQGDDELESTKALQTLIEGNVRFVVSVAKQYSGDQLSDLIAAGNEGLIKAARRFDATKGFKFISYAVWWIRQSITEHISTNSRAIRVPLNKQGLQNKYKKVVSKLEQQLEREPTMDEVIDQLAAGGDSLKTDSAKELFIGFGHTASLDAKIGGANSDSESTLLDVFVGEKDCYDVTAMFRKQSLNQTLKDVMKVKLVSQKEADGVLIENWTEYNIIVEHFGLFGNEQKSMNELAKSMNYTVERIRQIRDKALKKLKMSNCSKRLKEFVE